jgi:hypothetical protein
MKVMSFVAKNHDPTIFHVANNRVHPLISTIKDRGIFFSKSKFASKFSRDRPIVKIKAFSPNVV